MLHLARKAFYRPGCRSPCCTWTPRGSSRRLQAARRVRSRSDFDLLVHQNPECVEKGINPSRTVRRPHRHVEDRGLKQALDHYKFDAAFGGARRDEEKSRAKERVFSVRSAEHRWDPKRQRPELWRMYNVRRSPVRRCGCSRCRTGPSSTFWEYIRQEDIPSCRSTSPRSGPVVERDGTSSWSTTIGCRCVPARFRKCGGTVPDPGCYADRRRRVDGRDPHRRHPGELPPPRPSGRGA